MAKTNVTPVIFLRPGKLSERFNTSDSQYGNFDFPVLVRDFDSSKLHPINPSSYTARGLQDLHIMAQMDDGSCDADAMVQRAGTALYGYETRVKGYGIYDLGDLEAMVKTMRKIHKAAGQDRIARFEDYVLRVAEAIGAGFATADQNGDGMYSDYNWQYLSASEAASWIIWSERELRQQLLQHIGRAA